MISETENLTSMTVKKVDLDKSEVTSDFTSVETEIVLEKTEIILEEDLTEILIDVESKVEKNISTEGSIIDFKLSNLNDFYNIEYEILGGGMSRVFVVTNKKLGNKWIAKYIPNKIGELTNEENILKMLNHINLPSIIDIFHDETGICLVESFIEGETMDNVLKVTDGRVSQSLAKNWAEQLGQVFNYLHTFNGTPVFHLDMKPSNIMVTHDNKLVVIDFGISKKETNEIENAVAVTYQYAAPEQLKMKIPKSYERFIENRFGKLPEERLLWKLDARTDIYCLGIILFEILTGELPMNNNLLLLDRFVTKEFADIILKCIEIRPEDRFQSANEFLEALESIKTLRYKAVREMFRRRVATITAAIMFLISSVSFAGGNYVYLQETAAVVGVSPDVLVVSLQEFSEFLIKKENKKGKVSLIEPGKVDWSNNKDTIAYIDGNKIFGMNEGTTMLEGMYRNKRLEIKVNVVKPIEGEVAISQIYNDSRITEVYSGTTERESIDGSILSADFVSPESIVQLDDGKIYITDAGNLRLIENGEVSTINIEPDYIKLKSIRTDGKALYILTDAWEDEYGYNYGLIKYDNDTMEGLFITDAAYSRIDDFIVKDDSIYFIEYNAGVDESYLKQISLSDYNDINTLETLNNGACGLAADNDILYISNSELGVIYKYSNNKLDYFAGVEGEKEFIDGNRIHFYYPSKMALEGNYLYVWDFNTLRRIKIVDGVAMESETITGIASSTFDLNIDQMSSKSYDIILPNSKLSEFIVTENGILITDSKRGTIWRTDI